MIRHYPEPLAPAADSWHLSLEDFEEAGIRVAERRYDAKDTIFAPGDPDGQLFLYVRLTHQDLANMIFSTREAVSKVMSEFQRDGLIEARNRKIAISPRLAQMS